MKNLFRVHGPPGVGKTTWLASQVERAVAQFGPDKVMVVSFTKAAAMEVVSRATTVNEHNIGTLHAICFRALQSPTLAEVKIKEWNQTHPLYSMSGGVVIDVEDAAAEAIMGGGSGDALLSKTEILRGKMTPFELWPADAVGFYAKWDEWKKERGYLDFTDLIEVCLRTVAWAPGQPDVVFVDEAQDLNPLEMKLIHNWSSHTTRTVIVGDADQCLYEFKGSSPRGFLEPELPPDQQLVLRQSYRVPRRVHSVASEVIRRCAYRYPAEYLPRDADGQVDYRPSFISSEPTALITSVLDDLSFGKRVMILGSCSYMLHRTIEGLKRVGIPFHNPFSVKRGDWNPMRGGAARIQAFLDGSRRRWWTRSECSRWTEILEADGLLVRGGRKRLKALLKAGPPGEKMRFSDLYQCFETDRLDECLRLIDGGDAPAIEWLSKNILDSWKPKLSYALSIVARYGPSAIYDVPKVVVGTIHSVKGGEADTVYLFPDLSPQASDMWVRGGESRDTILRQVYVGMTRARDRLVLCGPSSRGAIQWPAIGS